MTTAIAIVTLFLSAAALTFALHARRQLARVAPEVRAMVRAAPGKDALLWGIWLLGLGGSLACLLGFGRWGLWGFWAGLCAFLLQQALLSALAALRAGRGGAAGAGAGAGDAGADPQTMDAFLDEATRALERENAKLQELIAVADAADAGQGFADSDAAPAVLADDEAWDGVEPDLGPADDAPSADDDAGPGRSALDRAIARNLWIRAGINACGAVLLLGVLALLT